MHNTDMHTNVYIFFLQLMRASTFARAETRNTLTALMLADTVPTCLLACSCAMSASRDAPARTATTRWRAPETISAASTRTTAHATGAERETNGSLTASPLTSAATRRLDLLTGMLCFIVCS